MDKPLIVIIGAGPAGLSAAYELVQKNLKPLVLERDGKVGGISRTEKRNGYYFDIGGHRFFTKLEKVKALWNKMLKEDFLEVSRMSRIYYKGRLFKYPLSMPNVLANLGPAESFLILKSYIKAKIFPYPEEKTFQEWTINRFGERLYKAFFKTYTEKVWGISCDRILSSWAEQRIKGLSVKAVIYNALFGAQHQKSLIGSFNYPVKGSGMMWERFQQKVEFGGGQVRLKSHVIALNHENERIINVHSEENGERSIFPIEALVSSIPITSLVNLLNPIPPENVLIAANSLYYRSFIIVVLIIRKKHIFPDQWMYVHSPKVRVGRIQNFKNWSAAMVPDQELTSIGMEYFCYEGDDIWRMSDEQMKDLACHELVKLGMVETNDVSHHYVFRQPKAYPVYDKGFESHLSVVREFLGKFKNLQTIGRNGMHRYNNMDHSMWTGILAAQNIAGASHDLWNVNEEEEYLEEDKWSMIGKSPFKNIIGTSFARLDKLGFATAFGSVSGLLVFVATIWLVIKGEYVVRPSFILLKQYFFGYTDTVKGAFIAFFFTFFWGFLFGWLFAYLRNFFLGIYLYLKKRKTDSLSFNDFLDNF